MSYLFLFSYLFYFYLFFLGIGIMTGCAVDVIDAQVVMDDGRYRYQLMFDPPLRFSIKTLEKWALKS